MKFLYLALIFAFASTASAQSFANLNDRKGRNIYDNSNLGVFFRYTNLSDPYNDATKGITMNASIRLGSYEKGGTSWSYENPTLGDFIYLIFNYKKAKDSKVNRSFGSGFFGWHQVYFNALVKERFILAPGLSLGDYIFAVEQPKLTTDPKTLEPNGYYFHLGPAVKASYIITDKVWVEGFIHNDIGFKAGSPGGNYQNIKGYKKPFFLNFGANVYSTSRFFGGFRVTKLIDRGQDNIKATRVDISAGYMFNW